MARSGAAKVFGIDLSEQRLEHGRRMASGIENVTFSTTLDEQVDLAITLNAFEHFPEPENNLRRMAASVRRGGRILITFGPPWFAPYGAHMHFFTDCPWVNLLFSEKTVLRVRLLYRPDGVGDLRYGPPQMTIRLFEQLIKKSGLEVERLVYKTVKNLPFGRIPIVRELFINHVTCILRKAT
jgi:SAM-dependent methyltransferase